MASMPTKIVLKSTTSISLNDRFSSLPKPSQPAQQSNVRSKMAAATQASQANRRLAQQMANRPSVQAALNKGSFDSDSIKQRLGSPNKGSVKSRLSLPGGVRGRGRGRGSPLRARGGLRAVRGGKATTVTRGRGVGYKVRGGRVQRAGQQGGRGMARGSVLRGRGGARGRIISRGARGRGGRIGRGGRGGRPVSKTKEQLDTDLDSYMSKSQAHLDAELDAYMAQLD